MDLDFYMSLLDNIDDGIYFTDCDRRITYWNKGAERITGYAAAAVTGTRCADNILVHVDEKGEQLCLNRCPLTETIASGRQQDADVYLRHKDGHRVPVRVRVTPLRDVAGKITGGVEVFTDNTAREALLHRLGQLQKMALYDALTELGNRRHGEASLRSHLDELQRYGWPFAVLFLDIDYFKPVNDKHGHPVGDRVLRMVARTLRDNVRSFDVVARWGGDEMLVILINVTRAQLEAIAGKLRLLVEQSALQMEMEKVGVTISIGGTPAHIGDTVETLMERADALMFESKRAGRNRVTLGV